MIPEKKTADLKEVLSGYYEGASFLSQEKAFRRVIRWKVDLEDIARSYNHVDWKKLSAVIKAETQGRTGNQVSHAKAVGMTQIKYQGAWAFVWNAMFSVKVKQGSRYVKDYHNANIRRRYRVQLDRIRQYLEDNAILVYPSDSSEGAFREARSRSWSNLKKHLKREYQPGEYQVAVDIAAMYLDHLRISFHKITSHVSEIKAYIENNGIVDPEFSGTKRIWWNRIKTCLEKDASYADRVDAQARTLEHLNSIIDRLEDPDIDLAAYNFGIRKVLEYIELGKALPETIEQYVKKVSLYRTIFDEIEEIRI